METQAITNSCISKCSHNIAKEKKEHADTPTCYTWRLKVRDQYCTEAVLCYGKNLRLNTTTTQYTIL